MTIFLKVRIFQENVGGLFYSCSHINQREMEEAHTDSINSHHVSTEVIELKLFVFTLSLSLSILCYSHLSKNWISYKLQCNNLAVMNKLKTASLLDQWLCPLGLFYVLNSNLFFKGLNRFWCHKNFKSLPYFFVSVIDFVLANKRTIIVSSYHGTDVIIRYALSGFIRARLFLFTQCYNAVWLF